MYCTDADLLRWEPQIAMEAAFASQTLLSSGASMGGTTLTIAGGGSLTASRVRAGQIAVLSGSIGGSFPIVSVDTESAMTLSILHEGLASGELAPLPIATTGLSVTVRTFGPQRQVSSELLTRMAGIDPSSGASVLNGEVLRKPCVLGTLQMIYNAMAAAAPSDGRADLIIRAELYEQLYRKSLRGVSVAIDTNGDGVADARRALRLVQFTRD